MTKIFKCDCGHHLIQFGYDGATKNFDFEEISVAIYELYSPDTGRKHRNPKLIGDVVLFDNASPKELTNFFIFFEKILKNRKKPKKSYKGKGHSFMKPALDRAIKQINLMNKKQWEKNKKQSAKWKKEK